MRGSLKVLGAMTGTSCDGMDIVCIEFKNEEWRILWNESLGYPAQLRKRVLQLQREGSSTQNLREALELHSELGLWYGKSFVRSMKGRQLPELIANHGQTIMHFPAKGGNGFTLQLGDPAKIAHLTGLTTVSNFRDGDIAAGGQGAPLVPKFHQLLGGDRAKRGISLHNIGGISNLTYLGPKGRILAFDTGPGNIWIDAAAEHVTNGKLKMDRDGKLGQKSAPDLALAARLLKHPYFKKPAPKSTGRNEFTVDLFLSHAKNREHSSVATATWITVESIARAYEEFILHRKWPLESIYVCGGGARNPHLMSKLQERLPRISIRDASQLGVDPQWIEASAFAYFGYLALSGKPLGGSWTGSASDAPSAHIIPGRNWNQILTKLPR